MIDDLNTTLEHFFSNGAPESSLLQRARVSFSPPTTEWQARLEPGPTLNLFLYDVRENRELRGTECEVHRTESGRVSRVRPPARVDCCYCITAWNSTSEDSPEPVRSEHQLLSGAFALLLAHRQIPLEHHQGRVAEELPPHTTLSAEPERIKDQAEFWSALGQRPRPSLTYAITLTMRVDEPAGTGRRVEQLVLGAEQGDSLA